MNPDRLLEPGTLWNLLAERTAEARLSGALQMIPTHLDVVEDAGVPFLVRQADARTKERSTAEHKRTGENPFLPYDREMFVAGISATHVALLNKFNVIEHHLLIVTRAFEKQQGLLTLEDFQALRACMAEFDGLGFYNSGTIAGASQPHRHLQLVPVPLGPGPERTPMDHALRTTEWKGTLGVVPGFPFQNAVTRVDASRTAKQLLERYLGLLNAIRDPAARRPYNLLVTRDWMLLVPRGHERFGSISVNALGFAGSLFGRDDAELRAIRGSGPMAVLRGVGIPTR